MTEQFKSITETQCTNPPARYDDLTVLMLNCTLTRSPKVSHTEGLLHRADEVFKANGVASEILRPVDYEIPAGLEQDYTGEDGYERDDWPNIQAKIDACDILIIGTSVWLGEKSSVCNRVLEMHISAAALDGPQFIANPASESHLARMESRGRRLGNIFAYGYIVAHLASPSTTDRGSLLLARARFSYHLVIRVSK